MVVQVLTNVYLYGYIASVMTRKVILEGRRHVMRRVVWGRDKGGRYLGEEFLVNDCSQDQRAKFYAVFEMIEEQGVIRNPKLFRYPLESRGNVGEFKTFKKRLFFYREGNDLVITHGSTKKQNETDNEDIKRLHRIKKEIEEQESRKLPQP
jgi:hypothetical protein